MRIHRLVSAEVEDGRPVFKASALSQRVEQRCPQRAVVERVLVVPLRRLRPEPVALNAGTMETIDGCPDHISPRVGEGNLQLVGEGRLPRGVWAVDRHPSRMREINRVDQRDEAANERSAIQQFCGRHPSHESASTPAPSDDRIVACASPGMMLL